MHKTLNDQKKEWYERRDALHLERAELRVDCLREACSYMAGGMGYRADVVEQGEAFVRAVMENSHATFAQWANELAECAPMLACSRAGWRLRKWAQEADERLGEWPRFTPARSASPTAGGR